MQRTKYFQLIEKIIVTFTVTVLYGDQSATRDGSDRAAQLGPDRLDSDRWWSCLGGGLLLHLPPLGSQSGQVCLGQPRFDLQPTIRTHYCGVVVDGRYDVRSPSDTFQIKKFLNEYQLE